MTAVIEKQKWSYGVHLYVAVAYAIVMLTLLAFYIAMSQPLTNREALNALLNRFTVLLPVIFIWLIAAKGARRFKNYAVGIRDSADGRSINYLANGLLLSVIYIILYSFVRSVVALADGTTYGEFVKIVANHVPLIVALSASVLLFLGSHRLVSIVQGQFWTSKRLAILLIPYLVGLIVFASDFARGTESLMYINAETRFGLPVSILLFSYFIPHAIVWLLGILSAVNIAWYARNVNGSIYKSLFTDIYKGIVLVYLAIFSTQLLVSSYVLIESAIINRTLVYAILLLAVAGYTYIYRGSAKLQRVEEIV